MTNKEAIEVINNRMNTYLCTGEDLQALDLAVKALEERPAGDLISREALKKVILARLDDDEARVSEIVKEEIDNAPAVEPPVWQIEFLKRLYEKVRPAGEWIREDEVHSKCSLCGFKYADYRNLFDYCPNCGARMEGGKK